MCPKDTLHPSTTIATLSHKITMSNEYREFIERQTGLQTVGGRCIAANDSVVRWNDAPVLSLINVNTHLFNCRLHLLRLLPNKVFSAGLAILILPNGSSESTKRKGLPIFNVQLGTVRIQGHARCKSAQQCYTDSGLASNHMRMIVHTK